MAGDGRGPAPRWMVWGVAALAAALLYEGAMLVSCSRKPTPATRLCHSLDWIPWPRNPTPNSSTP